MKMKNLVVIGAMSSILATQAMASGTRGGGHVIDVDATPYLMDLVTKTKCEWVQGADLATSLTSMDQILSAVASLDWYFAAEIKQEVERLDYCMTGPLYKVSPYDWEDATRRVRGEKSRQAGFRFYENAYIDTQIFSAMNAYNKAMLIIHEAMHTYLDMNTYSRSLKLRSIIKTIDLVATGKITTTSELHFNMRKNDIIFPRTSHKLEAFKDVILFFKGDTESRIAAILESQNPEKLVDTTELPLKLLSLSDQHTVIAHTNKALFKDALLELLKRSLPMEIALIVDQKSYAQFSPLKLALSEYNSFNDDQKQALRSTKAFKALSGTGLQGLNTVQVSYANSLIQASPVLAAVSGTKTEIDTPLMELAFSQELSSSMNWLPHLIVLLERDGKLNELVKDTNFNQAMNLSVQIQAVKNMQTRVKREKGYAVKKLELLSKSMKESLLESIQFETIDDEEFETIKAKLNL